MSETPVRLKPDTGPERPDCLDDLLRADAEPLQQFLGLAAARNLAHREAVHGEARERRSRRHRVAQSARRV